MNTPTENLDLFERSFDLAILGGGIAGLIAANRASALGLSVIVIEKGADYQYPCNSRLTGGLVHICFKSMRRSADELFDSIQNEIGNSSTPELSQLIANNASRLIDWMNSEGIRMIKASPDEAFSFVLAPPRIMTIGTSWDGRGGDVALRQLQENLALRGGQFLGGAAGKSLVFENERVSGILIDTIYGTKKINSKFVILADGGFQSNKAMLLEYITPAPQKLFQRNAQSGCGDGIRMAQALGAEVTGMNNFYGHVLCRSVFGNDDLWPYPIIDRLICAGIAIDGFANRFMDEGRGGVYHSNCIARLVDPLSTHVIFDKNIWEGPGKSFIFPPNDYLISRGGIIYQSNDIKGLAKIINVDEEHLSLTVNEYNNAYNRNQLEHLSVSRSTTLFPAYPIIEPPFYAVPLCAGITYTMGGLLIDNMSRVLNIFQKPIPGLLAAGCTTGGIEGGMFAGYVGGLSKSGITALTAADSVFNTYKNF